MSEQHSPLQRELQQSRPFTSLSEEGVIALMKTGDVINRFFGRIVEPRGITMQQYNVLRILRGAGKGGLPTMSIGERMIEQTPGLTRLIDRLETKGLVARRRCKEDRRQVFCEITDAGLELLAGLDPAMNDADERSLAMLDAGEQRMLIDLLAKVRGGHEP